MTDDTAPALAVEHLAKSYGPVEALKDVSFHVGYGEVLGLLGDNGAGKSTLIKALSGVIRPDTGRILLDGEPTHLRSVAHARAAGVSTVYQDLALVDTVSVYRNLFFGREHTVGGPLGIMRDRRMRQEAERQLAQVGISIPSVRALVGQLSGGQRQAIAVVRAIESATKVLLLDEPLAAMGAKEGALILDLIGELRARGNVAIVLIAHNYGQVMEVCDRIVLLQHGEITFDKAVPDTSLDELNAIMVDEYRAARRTRSA